MSTSKALTVGSISTGGSVYNPWPTQWSRPVYYYTYPHVPAAEYANEVEVERGEHDATLRFYRNRGNSWSLVKQITVPLGVLDWLTEQGA